MTFGWCSLEVMEDSDKSGFHGDNGMTNFMEVVQMRIESEENDRVSKTTHCFNHLLKIFIEFSTAVLSSMIHGCERIQKSTKGKVVKSG